MKGRVVRTLTCIQGPSSVHVLLPSPNAGQAGNGNSPKRHCLVKPIKNLTGDKSSQYCGPLHSSHQLTGCTVVDESGYYHNLCKAPNSTHQKQ